MRSIKKFYCQLDEGDCRGTRPKEANHEMIGLPRRYVNVFSGSITHNLKKSKIF
jgi:hypothetical protein